MPLGRTSQKLQTLECLSLALPRTGRPAIHPRSALEVRAVESHREQAQHVDMGTGSGLDVTTRAPRTRHLAQ